LQWPQENVIDDAEDGGIGADAQRQSEERHRGEAGVPPQGPDRESQILDESPHPLVCLLSVPREYLTSEGEWSYSLRSAWIGSIRAARRAGIPAASRAMASTNSVPPARNKGLSGLMP